MSHNVAGQQPQPQVINIRNRPLFGLPRVAYLSFFIFIYSAYSSFYSASSVLEGLSKFSDSTFGIPSAMGTFYILLYVITRAIVKKVFVQWQNVEIQLVGERFILEFFLSKLILLMALPFDQGSDSLIWGLWFSVLGVCDFLLGLTKARLSIIFTSHLQRANLVKIITLLSGLLLFLGVWARVCYQVWSGFVFAIMITEIGTLSFEILSTLLEALVRSKSIRFPFLDTETSIARAPLIDITAKSLSFVLIGVLIFRTYSTFLIPIWGNLFFYGILLQRMNHFIFFADAQNVRYKRQRRLYDFYNTHLSPSDADIQQLRSNPSLCAICRSPNDPDPSLLFKLSCNHIFHRACIIPWLRRSSTCPTCRHDIPTLPPLDNSLSISSLLAKLFRFLPFSMVRFQIRAARPAPNPANVFPAQMGANQNNQAQNNQAQNQGPHPDLVVPFGGINSIIHSTPVDNHVLAERTQNLREIFPHMSPQLLESVLRYTGGNPNLAVEMLLSNSLPPQLLAQSFPTTTPNSGSGDVLSQGNTSSGSGDVPSQGNSSSGSGTLPQHLSDENPLQPSTSTLPSTNTASPSQNETSLPADNTTKLIPEASEEISPPVPDQWHETATARHSILGKKRLEMIKKAKEKFARKSSSSSLSSLDSGNAFPTPPPKPSPTNKDSVPDPLDSTTTTPSSSQQTPSTTDNVSTSSSFVPLSKAERRRLAAESAEKRIREARQRQQEEQVQPNSTS